MTRSRQEDEPISLKDLQARKAGLIRGERGNFSLSLAEAAKTISTPIEALENLIARSQAFVVYPDPTGERLVFSVSDWWPEKDLWKEVVLASICRGRSALAQVKGHYLSLFTAAKLIWEANGKNLKDLQIDENSPPELLALIDFARQGGHSQVLEETDLADLQAIATILFFSLPEGTRRALSGDSQSPEFILTQRL